MSEVGLAEVLHALKHYQHDSLRSLMGAMQDTQLLSQHSHALQAYRARLSQVGRCMATNQILFDAIIQEALSKFPCKAPVDASVAQVLFENCQILLKQLTREWSVAGREERRLVYDPIIKILKEQVALDGKVLVPGAGLGRLVYEIAMAGYYCDGNECSHFMHLAFEFICSGLTKQFTIYPEVHDTDNMPDASSQVLPLMIPDVIPQAISMGMTAGRFLAVHGNDVSDWDAIVTCFFFDSVIDIIQNLRVIHRALKPGGIWINCDPLNFNVAKCTLTWSEIEMACAGLGFRSLSSQLILTSYAQNPQSMSQSLYQIKLSVFKK